MGFRPDAPVVIRQECEIASSPKRVWSVLAAVERWPRWHRRIQFVRLPGALSQGASVLWASDGMKFASVVAHVHAEHRLGLTLRTFGARGYLRWSLAAGPAGRTRVRLEESWEGVVVRLLSWTLRRTLESSRAEWLERLVDECESGGGDSAGSDRAEVRGT